MDINFIGNSNKILRKMRLHFWMLYCLETALRFSCIGNNLYYIKSEVIRLKIIYPHGLGAAIILTAHNEWFVIIFIRSQK